MADDALEGVKGALRSINFADIGVRLSLAAAAVAGTGMLICVPNGRQKDVAAERLFQKPFSQLRPTEKKAAEFVAAHRRWTGFFENSVYPLTRKLPGANKPLLNPYKKRARGATGGDESF
jgi:hypothetical protein